MLRLLPKLPAFYSFRRTGWPRKLPMNLTLSVSYSCNSRCKTCNIYKKKSRELTLNEWENIFKGIGRNLFWVTMSGGEPFLRPDIAAITTALYDICRPSVINIPTNGLLTERICGAVQHIARHCRESQVIVNVSIDEIGEKHDIIRGIPGSYAKAVETFTALKSLDLSNLTIGIHTVISRFNVKRIPEIYRHLMMLKPDSYISEIAEEREELGTIGSNISPEYSDYAEAVDFLAHEIKTADFKRAGKITRAFRMKYYDLAKKILREKRQVIPCYSGFASAQIAPDGDVWMCCIKAKSIGNLRDVNYDFSRVWFSAEADDCRNRIKIGECFCPLANAAYTNMLHNPKIVAGVGFDLIRANLYGR
jgi:MoaA/NifB/PqqE/SkfB family radical SAM enzyme